MVITMMGTNDSRKHHLPYEGISASKIQLFLRDFRTYKLARLLWLHIITKAREIGLYKPKENKGITELESSFPTMELKKRYTEKVNFNKDEEAPERFIEPDHREDRVYLQLGWRYRDQ